VQIEGVKMEYYGFAGRILRVNLSTGEVGKTDLDLDLARRFIGGSGIDYKLIYDQLKPGTDPYSPENPIIISAGPLIGTLAPMANKVALTTKMPTIASKDGSKYFIGTSVTGSRRFGLMLKNAGYDHIIITGAAAKPSYLKIIDDDVEICDATDLWGKRDIYETTDELMNRYKGSGVFAIGRAGEKMVRMSLGFVDNSSSLGSNGAAAVAGSKKLKAIVVYGTKGIRISDSKRFMALVDRARVKIFDWLSGANIADYEGIPQIGSSLAPKYAKGYTRDIYFKTIVGHYACTACVAPCREIFEIRDGRFRGYTYRGFLGGVGSMGQSLKLEDYRETMRLLDLINRNGLDSFTMWRMLQFVPRLYEHGEISKTETDGLELARNFDCYADLVEKIANREGLGNVMADGWYALSKKIGIDPEQHHDGAPISKGVVCFPDPRGYSRYKPGVTSSITSPRSHHHSVGPLWKHTDMIPYEEAKSRFADDLNLSEADTNRIFPPGGWRQGRLEKHCDDLYSALTALGICCLYATQGSDAISIKVAAELYSAGTGIEVNAQEFKKRAERIWNLYRLLNVREGFTREDDTLPYLWVKAAETGTRITSGEIVKLVDYFYKELTPNDLEQIIDEDYDERGWDIRSGIPTKETLMKLGLKEFVNIINRGKQE
jgi:aldehyde:ferredoxin oxidoreductase